MLIILFIFTHALWAAEPCEGPLASTAEEMAGARALHQREPTLSETKMVRRVSPSKNPEERIAAWLRALESGDAATVAAAKLRLNAKVLTRRVSERFFELQIEIDRNRGFGTTVLSPEKRKALEKLALHDQRQSLDAWLDYLARDTHYPAWAKYWALTAVTKLSTFDREGLTFNRRGRGQAAPFPELNREALRRVMTQVITAGPTRVSFARAYARELGRSVLDPKMLARTDGEWRKFERGQSAEPLAESLDGMGTGWCTVGIETAQAQLNAGDFYVYYSRDDEDRARYPRLAIRFDGDVVTEVRGIGPQQNLDAEIAATTILSDKLEEFGAAGRHFVRASADMRRVTEIARKGQLDAEDLRFLYEIDTVIVGFGYRRDPRIDDMLNGRDVRADLVAAFRGEVRGDQISLDEREARRGGIEYHRGDLYWSSSDSDMPRRVSGDVEVHYALHDDIVRLPDRVGRDMSLRGLRTIDGLPLPKYVGGLFRAPHLIEAANVSFAGGSFYLPKLRVAENVSFSEELDGQLDLSSLRIARNVVLPRSVGRMHLTKLQEAPGLVLPEVVREQLDLPALRHDRGMTWPRLVGGILTTSQWCSKPPTKAKSIAVKHQRLSTVNL